MKITTIGLSALLASFGQLVAIERPAGERGVEQLPARPAEPQGGILRDDQKEGGVNKAPLSPRAEAPPREKLAYLGVGGEPAGEALLMHLNLEGALLLTTIDPTSPAGVVGLKVNDIITEVDGKKLSDQDSLRAALFAEKPGAEVSLSVIRRGKVINQKVTLGESRARRAAYPQVLAPDRAAGMNQLLEDQLGNALGGLGNPKLQKELMEQLEKALGNQGAGFKNLRLDLGANLLNGEDMKMGIQGIGSMRLEDEEGSIEMKRQNGQRELSIRDKAGKLLFSGPYDSEVDKAAVPEEYRERVERLDTGSQNSFQFRLNGQEMLENLRNKLEAGE